MKPTLEDVARRAGVSTATVSRSLNAPASVRPLTRERVERVIAELGYTPNFGARALASNRTNTVGVVIPTMANAIFAQGIQAMEEALSAQGITLLLATSGYDPEQERRKIEALIARGVDAIALIGEARPVPVYDMLRARALPYLVLWSHREGSPHPSVGFDNHAAARAMAETVVAHGHTRVAMIAGETEGNDRAAARVAGVRAALRARQISLRKDYLFECPYSIEAGRDAARALLALSKPPTAILCGNDVLAAGALIGAREAGLSVPADVSITGFDDIDLAAAVSPGLTTVHTPHRWMGEAAAESLHALIGSGGAPDSRCFETEIVLRESLGPPP